MKPILRFVLLLVYLVVFFVPGYTFFAKSSGTTEILTSGQADLSIKLFTIFRLFGLYAFTLVWSQIMLGAFRLPLTRLYGARVLKLHMALGIFTLLFASFHPILFM